MNDPVIYELYCGEIAPLGVHGAASGIAKRAVPGPWTLTHAGIVGDHQGNTKQHGGPEKALHHYPREHYAAWRSDEPLRALFAAPPAFGENLSTLGVTEDEACIGDIYRLGAVILQISQGRQPCWRLNAHSGWSELAWRVRETVRTGWYYRVLRPGIIEPGSAFSLAERPQPEWTVARVMRAMLAQEIDKDELAAIATINELSEGWKQTCRKRIASNQSEDWRKRFSGPA